MLDKSVRLFISLTAFVVLGVSAFTVSAACRDSVVLVHGNTGYPSDWNNTYNTLRNKGYSSSDIYRPNWGSKWCAACNDHHGSEETPVRSAIQSALSHSCTGKIDVIAHSMGVTLAAQQIMKLGVAGRVDTFVGIAGAMRGLNSCGIYPYNMPNSTCGYYGLSVNSPFIRSIKNHRFGNKMYSIKSYYDEVVCAGLGGCFVSGTHTSNIWYQNGSYTYNYYGHFGLQKYTYSKQVSLIQ